MPRARRVDLVLQDDLRETARVVGGFAGDTGVATSSLDRGENRRGFFALDLLQLGQEGGIRLRANCAREIRNPRPFEKADVGDKEHAQVGVDLPAKPDCVLSGRIGGGRAIRAQQNVLIHGRFLSAFASRHQDTPKRPAMPNRDVDKPPICL